MEQLASSLRASSAMGWVSPREGFLEEEKDQQA